MDPKLKEAGWEKYAEFKVTCHCWVHDIFTTSNNTDTVFQKIVFLPVNLTNVKHRFIFKQAI